jgi:glycosyltransferase involved in cell wall biosynthesis
LSHLRRFNERIEFVRGPLNDNEFSRLIAGLDVMVLPYQESRGTQLQGSGLVVDATAHEVPVVATAMPTLAEFVGDGGILVDNVRDIPLAVSRVACAPIKHRMAAKRNAQHVRELVRQNDLVSALLA